MKISFEKSKDGNDTCKIDGIYLHSTYSPVKEAERFASLVNATFIPEIIFVIEPGLSYCADFLKKRFSDNPKCNIKTKIVSIRLCSFFTEFNSKFDEAINYFDYNSRESFESDLFNMFGEEELSYSVFQLWEPSGKIFRNETIEVFEAIKNVINKSHSVLATRSFFEKRWIMNSIRLGANINKTASIKKTGSCPIIICASGPSLKKSIPIIKEKKDRFIIAVSSAINPLLKNNIIPDLCISTDGGYWAKTHLKSLSEKTIFALSAEGNCWTSLIKNSVILPLTYSDGIESRIFESTGIKSFTAERCGTVSGTALDFAMKLTSGDIYFCGLDLCLSNGFQHTQPNLIEISNSIYDNRLNSCEKRNCVQGFSNQKASLKIYENWFKTFITDGRKIFRVIENAKNQLGEIKDISFLDFEKINCSGAKPVFYENGGISAEDKVCRIKEFIEKNSRKDEWLYNCFPTDYLNYRHNYDDNQKEGVFKKILEQNETLLLKIGKLCEEFTGK